MQTLFELYNNRTKYDDGVGIEIEIEGTNLPYPEKTPYWRAHEDGSLRGGLEYVSQGPLPCTDVKTKALKLLYKNIYDKANVSGDQSRCGIHAHINMQNLEISRVYTAIVVSFLLDGLLLKYTGRENNLFCKSVKSNKGLIKLIESDFLKGKPFNSLIENDLKYSSINLYTLRKFGTLEFRSMGFASDPEEVDEWTSELANMVYSSASSWQTPKEFMDWFVHASIDALLIILFSKDFIVKLKSVPGWRKAIENNIKICSSIAYGSDWSTLAEKPIKVGKKKDIYRDEIFAAVANERGFNVFVAPPLPLRGV